MKHIIMLLSVILLTTTGVFAQSETKTVTLEVIGMSCQKGCADGLDAKFSTVNGIISSETSFAESTSKITYNPKAITEKEVIKVVTAKGFKASVQKKQITKTTCSKNWTASCCNKIKT